MGHYSGRRMSPARCSLAQNPRWSEPTLNRLPLLEFPSFESFSSHPPSPAFYSVLHLHHGQSNWQSPHPTNPGREILVLHPNPGAEPIGDTTIMFLPADKI